MQRRSGTIAQSNDYTLKAAGPERAQFVGFPRNTTQQRLDLPLPCRPLRAIAYHTRRVPLPGHDERNTRSKQVT